MSEQRPHQLLRQKEIVIPFRDLNPEIQNTIKLINHLRTDRVIQGDTQIASASAFAIYQTIRQNHVMNILNAAWLAHGLRNRAPLVKDIQNEHEQMKERPLINSSAENKYPRDWIHVTEIKKTHPIFYVKKNGDLVLVKPSRMEYYRYLYQHKLMNGKLGRAGTNMWRWRGYLEPPKAPESVKKWASEKLKRAMEQLRPQPKFRPALVRVHQRISRTSNQRRKIR